MTRRRDARDRAWQLLVALVMDTRGDWRRAIGEATGLPFSRYRALHRLAAEPRTLRDLAESMTIDAPAATVLVNDLEARGLVERTPHPDDRRAKLVSLTPEGRRVLHAARAVRDRAPPAFDALGPDDVEALLRIAKRLRST